METSGHTNIISENQGIQSKYNLHFALITLPLNVVPTTSAKIFSLLKEQRAEQTNTATPKPNTCFFLKFAVLSGPALNQLPRWPEYHPAFCCASSQDVSLLTLHRTGGSLRGVLTDGLQHAPTLTLLTDGVPKGGRWISGGSRTPPRGSHRWFPSSPLHQWQHTRPQLSDHSAPWRQGAAHLDSPHYTHSETG